MLMTSFFTQISNKSLEKVSEEGQLTKDLDRVVERL